MPLPNNYLSAKDEQNVILQLTASFNGLCATIACPDARFAQLVNGTISLIPSVTGSVSYRNRDIVSYLNNNAYINRTQTLNNVIAIILESPHVDEYIGPNIAPAMGYTGRLFFKHFNALFSHSSLYGQISKNITYDLVFVNSVQYQTSCGAKPLTSYKNKLRRDNNWIYIFQNYSSSDLQNRLRALKPVLIINLCTKGLKGLNSYVDKAIMPLYPNIYTVGDHPSNWYKHNARIN